MKQHSIYKHIAAAVVVMASCFALSSVPVSAEKNIKGLELSLNSRGTKPKNWAPWYIYVKPGEKAIVKFTVTEIEAGQAGHKGEFTFRAPGGAVIAKQKVDASSYGLPGNTEGKPSEILFESPVATEAGVYSVEAESGLNMPHGYFYMDWLIGATKTTPDKIIPGRVWSDWYRISGHREKDIVDLPLFYVSKEGYQYKAEYRGFMGFDSLFRTDRYGVVRKGSCESAYESYGSERFGDVNVHLRAAAPSHCGGQYKVFFAKPDPSLPQSVKLPNGQTTWLNNEIKNTSIENMKFVSANDKNVPLKGEVTATIKNYTGNTTLLVDTNGNKKFNDPEDRKIIFNTEGEQAKYLFDGKDNQGNIIPKNIRVTFRIDADKKGEIHFIRDDIEISKGGMSIERLNGSPKKRSILYWNDSKLSTKKCGVWNIEPMNNYAGVDSTSGVHSWNANECKQPNGKPSYGNSSMKDWTTEQHIEASSWGDNRFINDWTYDEGSARSSTMFYGEATPDPKPEEPAPEVPNTGSAQLTANGTKALPWLLGAGAIAYYLRRRA